MSAPTQARTPQFTLDRETAAAALSFLARHMRDADVHSVLKALYRAELEHLRDYGRLIAWDQYRAMEYGPVPMTIYNAMCIVRGDDRYGPMDEELVDRLSTSLRIGSSNAVQAVGEPDIDALSDSEVECLTRAADEIGSGTFESNTNLSHDAAWASAWDRQRNGPIHLDDMLDQLPNGDAIRHHLEHTLATK